MSDPVLDVVAKRLQRRLDRLRGPGRTDDRQRRGVRCEGADPTGDEKVAEVPDVVAVQMGDQQRRQSGGAHAHGRRALQHPTPAVHQKHLPPSPHQSRRAGAVRVGDRTSGPQQRDLDHGPYLASRGPPQRPYRAIRAVESPVSNDDVRVWTRIGYRFSSWLLRRTS
jgi:hypothetical protein